MNDPYAELRSIWDRFIDGDRLTTENDILALLHSQGVRLRQDDGKLKQLTVSKPISTDDALVIGLRYLKRDGTQTEDHFAFQAGRPVQLFYRGSLEKKWLEYRTTHKQQVLFTLVDVPAPMTSVNTITMVRGRP